MITLYGNLDLGGLTLTGNSVSGHLYTGEWLTASFQTLGGGVVQVMNLSPVPEPATFALLLAGLLVTAGAARRRG